MRLIFATLLVLISTATLALAQTVSWQMSLGKTNLGVLNFDIEETRYGPHQTLSMVLENTPFAVADGPLKAWSRPGARGVTRYAVQTIKDQRRRLSGFRLRGGHVVRASLNRTRARALLDRGANAGMSVLDPVAMFAGLVTPTGCPKPVHMFDGSRFVQLSPTQTQLRTGVLTCEMRLNVTAGSGYLAPLRFRSLRLKLTYGWLDDTTRVLDGLDVRAGFFTLRLRRLISTAG